VRDLVVDAEMFCCCLPAGANSVEKPATGQLVSEVSALFPISEA
jgi:hypothetical protein